MAQVEVCSPKVSYTPNYIDSTYTYDSTQVTSEAGKIIATPKETVYRFRLEFTVLF